MSGAPQQAQTMMIDAADLRRLRCTAEDFEALIASFPDLYFRVAPDGAILDYRARVGADLYVPPEEFLGKLMFDVLPAEGAATLREGLARALAGGRMVTCEYPLPMPQGEQRYEARLVPTPDGNVAAFVRNVSAAWQLRERTERTASLLRATLESTADGILVLDRQGRMTDWNSRFVEITRIPADILARRDEQAARAFLRDQLVDAETFGERFGAPFDGPEEESLDLMHFKDGRTIERCVRPHRHAGEIHGSVLSFRDITVRQQAELERSRLLDEAREAVRIRDEFLSIASHELRTPLTSSQLALQMIQQWFSRPEVADLPGFLHTALETAVRQGRQITRLLDELLSVTRIRTGRLELNPEEMDLAGLLNEVIDTLREPLNHAGCAIVVRAAVPVAGRWDRLRLAQVITNLLTNAIRYGAGQPIEVSLDADPEQARLSVRDHGAGIPVEEQGRIFQRFERAASAAHYGGLGLGLYIARQILEAHGGSIAVSSRPGEGACFRAVLPRQAPKGPVSSRSRPG